MGREDPVLLISGVSDSYIKSFVAPKRTGLLPGG